jgi:hypothetical protein
VQTFWLGLLLPAADREPQSVKVDTRAIRPSKRSRDLSDDDHSSFTVLLPVSAPELSSLSIAALPPSLRTPYPAFQFHTQEGDVDDDDDDLSVFGDAPSSKRLCRVLSTDNDESVVEADMRLAGVLPAGHCADAAPVSNWGDSFLDALGDEEVFC